jgi:hypothetical protein
MKAMVKESNPLSERILFVLSDWQPAPSKEYANYKLDSEVKKAEQYGKIYGIWINSSAVEKYYSNHIVINSVYELPELIINILKSNIKRG